LLPTTFCKSAKKGKGRKIMSGISDMLAGIAFVVLAAANVAVMLEARRHMGDGAATSRLIAAHRIVGYSFVILFCIMTYSMSQRLAGVGITGHLPTYLVFHIVLVLILVPLLLLKIVIARRYKQSQSSLKALGVAIFVVSFVLVAIPAFSEILRSANPGSLGARMVTGLVIAVCLVQCVLFLIKSMKLRDSKKISNVAVAEAPATTNTFAGDVGEKSSITLRLTQTEPQTHDTRTLRFQILNGRRLCAKPGQFLTFQWTISGQRVPRSFTISSSPIHDDYAEITAKRMENGRVSVFLNESAKPGLEVEASGPFGRFYFDESRHESIILIAAGSGITPMMSMLSYIDDLKLTNPVTLLYCVRTHEDIIFQNELVRLRTSLPNFKYEVCLSRPHPAWKGPSGRLTEEFVTQHVTDVDSPTFFLCGPKGFMDSAYQILLSLGIRKDRILQESFGDSKPSMTSFPGETRTVERVVFVQSEKDCQAFTGSTLLEVAEKNGVQIPYGCRSGLCGTCCTRVLSGTVQMDLENCLTTEQKDAGFVLPCVCRVRGPVVVEA
jgi:ferredoxin-NADP reductase